MFPESPENLPEQESSDSGSQDAPAPDSPGRSLQPASGQDLPESEERLWAVAAHLASVIGWVGVPAGHLLAPLLIWLFLRDRSEFVRIQALESLNFQISVTIYSLAAAAVAFTVVGLVVAVPALFLLVLFDIVLTIVGAVRVSQGETYRYPLTIRLVK